MSATVTVQGATLSLVLSTLGSFADLGSIETDTLLQELRQRYIAHEPTMVVKIVPFSEVVVASKRGHKKNA